MSSGYAVPSPARHLAGFPPFLRGYQFPTSAEQTIAFLSAVELLGPSGIEDVHRAAVATLAPPHDRIDEFDALFRAWFHGDVVPIAADSDDETELAVHEQGADAFEAPESPELDESGQAATATEMLATRRFAPGAVRTRLRRFSREAPERLPRRQGFRRRRARSGDLIDLRRALRAAVRNDGDAPALYWRRRRLRHRRILLLIDVSGSMREQTETTLRFAHALYHAAERMECFTIGTRLTRVSRALRRRNVEQALANAATLVPDWDGGTRLGDALRAFLAVPRFAGYARGALVIVLSDGLERGTPAALIDAMARLSRLAWRVSWLTPLAADAAFRPETEALVAVAPYLDALADGASTDALCDHVLNVGDRMLERSVR